MKNMWELTERLSDEELERKTNALEKNYVGGHYKHKNGEVYKVIDITTVNIDGTSYWGFIYIKMLTNGRVVRVRHTRPMYEFLDGRFTLQ